MAILRPTPYGVCNFLVTIDGQEAHFAEVHLPTADIEITEYRDGADRANEVRRIPGLTKYTHLTLKRGVTGSLDLWQWFAATRDGQAQRRAVTVTLLDEARNPVVTYRLRNCLPVKYAGPALRAGASDVAIEEVHLLVDSLDIE